MATVVALLALGAAILVWIMWPLGQVSPAGVAVSPEYGSRGEPVRPVLRVVSGDQRKVALGARLFREPRLSGDETLSCASCHDLRGGGADSRARSVGVGGQVIPLNTPTVFNSRFNHRQYWDARADSLLNQTIATVINPLVMGGVWPVVIEKLNSDPDYRREFAALYPNQGIDATTVSDAIVAFEETLVTPDSPFDRWLRGEVGALPEDAQQGYRRFKELGCIACHQGVNLGGNMIAGLGLMGDYFGERGRPVVEADLGRFNVTGRNEDRHLFKVPGLRNVARTAPYFHDGSVATLEEAVDLMARYQLGVKLALPDRRAIVAFLESLDGRLPE